MSGLTLEQETFIVQFFHPEKEYPDSPGMNEAVAAALLGVDLAIYQKLKTHFSEQARQAACELLADSTFAEQVDRLPFAPGSRVVGLGDSITDDYQSWLEILRYLLAFRRPQDGITVINAGISGHTITQMISRFLQIARQQPDWIICLAGTNDTSVHGLKPINTLVSLSETTKNMAMLRNFAATQTTARWVWMTPPLVLEEKVAAHWLFSDIQMSWSNQALRALADLVRQQPDPVVDLQAVFGNPPHPTLLIDDGVHPSLAGQMAIARAVVERLSAC
jgi:acyl-CoA thioesterase I